MKAITAVCATGAPVPPIASGRVQRARGGENEEIQMYIAKLKDLVPFMPKNRKISKLEVIQHVIEYIGELQSALDTHPAAGAFDPAAVLGPAQASAPRRPLGPLSSSNSLLSASPAPLSPSSQQHSMHTQSPDKTSQLDRLVSC